MSSFLTVLFIALGIALVVTLPRFIRIMYVGIRHLPVDGSVRQIGLAVRDALCEADLLRTECRRLKVLAQKLDDGSFAVTLTGGTYYEEALFADSLAEVFGMIENPRYLITRVGRVGRKDYHAVPYMLGINKERANMFFNIWHQRVSPGELIYTRSADGREILLKARARAFSTAMAPRAERRDRWQ